MSAVQGHWPIIVLVTSISVLIPVVSRVLSSPIAIVLFFPLLVLLVVFTFLASNIIVSHALDSYGTAARKPSNDDALLNAARPLAFATPAAWQAVRTRSQWSSNPSPHSLPPLCPSAPSVSAALSNILIMIVRDFVLIWYKPLSPSPSFPTSVSSTLHASIENMLERVEKIDLPTLLVRGILPKITKHVEQFRQSESALRGVHLDRGARHSSDDLDLLLASRYAGRGGRLHPAVDNLSSTVTRPTEEVHIRNLVSRALPFILPEDAAQSEALKIVVREIVACAVLAPVMDMFTDPDFWNRTIDQLVSSRYSFSCTS